MKNHVHLPTGENEEIYFYGIMTERFGLFSTLWQRTLNSRPHKNPPMGSRSAVLNAVLLKLVAKEKGCSHSFMIFQIRFNLLGGIFLPWRPQNPRKIENLELKRQFPWLLHRRCLINSKKADSGNPWAGFCGLSALRPVVVFKRHYLNG